jgi:chromosomal replication initiation ATPase DnaA
MSLRKSTEQTGRNGKRYTPMIEIMAAVCKQYGTNPREVRSDARHKHLVAARKLFIFRAMEECGDEKRSLSQIARYIGRDHTTVMYHFYKPAGAKYWRHSDAKRPRKSEAGRHSAGDPCGAGGGCPGG